MREEKKLRLISANDGKIEHFGEREVSFRAEDAGGSGTMGMIFQVSDVRTAISRGVENMSKGEPGLLWPRGGG